MLKAFRSEWIKIRRRSVLIGGAAMSVFAVLFSYLGAVRVTSAPGKFGGGAAALTRAALTSDRGLTTLASRGATLIDVIAFVLVAAAMASEYSQGTLRNLLVRQSGRLRLLSGKFLAMLLYIYLAASVAFVLGAIVITVTVQSKNVDTSAWTSSTGLTNLLTVYGDFLLAATAWCVFGFFAAIVFRSAAAAIGVGLAYVLVFEGLLTLVWDDAPRWLFGRLVDDGVIAGQDVLNPPALAAGSYGRSLLLVGCYVAVFVLVSGTLFRRRDVST